MRFSLLLLLFPILGFGQITIKGSIKDQKTGKPIEFANIYAKGTLKGTLSDEEGAFSLNQLSKNDTIIISAIGYDELNVPAHSQTQEYFLSPTVYELKEVVIPSGVPVVREYGFEPKKIKKNLLTSLSHGLIWDGKSVSHTAAQAARHIKNTGRNAGFIQSVSFFIHKQGRPGAPFRVRLIEMKANNQPGRDLITDNLIVQATRGDIWLEVNLADRQIEFPANGFLVSMEWLQTQNESYWYETSYKKIMKNNPVYGDWKEKNQNRHDFWGYGQIVGLYNRGMENSRCWRSDIQREWYSFINRSGELMIKSKIKIWE